MKIVEIEPGSAQRAPQDTTPHNSHVCVAGFMQFSGPAMQYVILLYFSQNSNTKFGILNFLLSPVLKIVAQVMERPSGKSSSKPIGI